MTASLAGVYNLQAFTSAGDLADGYRLYTYAPGTTTHKDAYTTAAANVAHTYTSDGAGGQFIALDSRGEIPAPLFLTSGGYDLCLKTNAGATVWTRRAYGADEGGLLKADIASPTFTGDVSFPNFTIDADGRIWGAALHNNSGAMTGTVNQYIGSGTYTPSTSNSFNLTTATPRLAQWIRVGNVVHVGGSIYIDPTGSGTTTVNLSLPIASDFANAYSLAGTATSQGPGAQDTFALYANATDNTAVFTSTGLANTSAVEYSYTFTYLVVS